MAAPDLSAVVALCNKAFDLYNAGHMARSAEYDARSLAAAQALGEEDCLIVASLQLAVANSMLAAAHDHVWRRVAEAAPPIEPAITLFFDAAATLQRRRAAGTLMGGCCRATEETWYRVTYDYAAIVQDDSEGRVRAAAHAPLVGYTIYLVAAHSSYRVLFYGDAGLLSLTQAQQRVCVVLMADAAELMMQPRIHESNPFVLEGDLMDVMQRLMTHPELILPHGADGARLLDSWRRLQQTGVLQRRRVEIALQFSMRNEDAERSAAAAAAAAPGLRSCALEACLACEKHPQHFKSCAACRIPVYCCKEHQTEHWPSHKAACKAARKAAAEQNQAD